MGARFSLNLQGREIGVERRARDRLALRFVHSLASLTRELIE